MVVEVVDVGDKDDPALDTERMNGTLGFANTLGE